MSIPSAEALGLTPRQLAFIVQDEAASLDHAAEAARRMLRNPGFTSGQLRSPAAFYRGILRRVVAEFPAPPKAVASAVPLLERPPVKAPPPEAASRILNDLVRRLAAKD